MSQELFQKSVEEVSLWFVMTMNDAFIPDAKVIEKKWRDMMRVFGKRARFTLLLWGAWIIILDTLIIQLWLLYFTMKAVLDSYERAKSQVSQELWPEARQRSSLIFHYITPIVKQSVDNILYNSQSNWAEYTDAQVQSAIWLLEDFFVWNGWEEYFEIAKLHYPYMNAWMK